MGGRDCGRGSSTSLERAEGATMTEPSIDATGRDEQIAAILGGYLEAAEAGHAPDRALLLEQHPELAGELAAFFDQQERFAGLVAPLRQAAQAARGEEPTEAGGSSATPPSAEAATWPEDDLPPGPGETVAAPPPPDRGEGDHRDEPDPLPRGARVRYFGDYELHGVLGQGGMGVVYRARQLSLNRPVALKMIRAGAWAGDDEVRRFQNEAEAVANLDHPRIVTVHEVGQFQGRHYFSMKLIEGPSLDQQLGDFAARPRDAAGLVAEIARAVHHAHQRGVLHRDLKPSNILLDPEGRPHVTDFGLAKRLEEGGARSVSGAIVGTPPYMSPEQAAGQRGAITTATDVYGVGTILYALLTGKPPFQADSVLETLEQVRQRAPEPPSKENRRVPRDLEVVCLKCLEKDPHRRYDSAAALADDLERYLADKPIMARPAGSLERGWRWCRRNPVVAGSLSAAAAALLAVAGLSLLYAHRQARDAVRIRQLATERTTESLKAREQAQLAKEQARRAIIALAQSNLNNAALNYERGQEECEKGEIGLGLVRLVESWRSAVAAGSLGTGWQHTARTSLSAWQYSLPKLQAVFSHAGVVTGVAFSPDGKTVITGSQDHTARLWDAATGQPIGRTLTHGNWVRAVAFSPDGKTVITGSWDKSARLWDAATGQPIGPPLTHQGLVYAVAFSPDGKTVITGGADKTARLWDVATGQPLGQPLTHPGWVMAVAFSPDGKTVITGSSDKTAQLWDVATGQPLTHLNGGPAVAFSPDGKSVISASEDHAARVWDAATGQPIGPPLTHQGSVTAVAFSPDGKTVITGSQDKTVRLWDAATGLPIGQTLVHQGTVWKAAFSPDGKNVITGSQDKTARLWDTPTGQRSGQTLTHQGPVTAVAFSPDGKTVITGSQDKTAQLWDVATGQPLGQTLAHPGRVMAVAFSPDGKTVITGSQDKTAQLWDAATGQSLGEP
jgi:WD40 repeat protein